MLYVCVRVGCARVRVALWLTKCVVAVGVDNLPFDP